jgi:hypothetical protein
MTKKAKEPFIEESAEKPASVDLETVKEMIALEKTETIDQAVKEAVKEAKLEIEKQMQSAQASFLTIFGIFASILSFLTIEFQFLKGLEEINQIIGFTLILWALLFSFNMALDYVATSRLHHKKVKLNKYFTAAVVLIFALGIAFLAFDKNFWWMRKLFREHYHLRNSHCVS